MKTPLANRLIQARDYAKIRSQKDAALLCGWESQSRLGNYESGTREPKLGELKRLADAYGVSFSWLATGEGDMLEMLTIREPGVRYQVNQTRTIPLLTLREAATQEWEKSACEKITIDAKQSTPSSYAVRMSGDSMVNPHGKPSIPDGAIVFIDRESYPKHGQIVVATLEGQDEAIIKQFVIDGGKKYLKSLNPIYPLIPLEQAHLLLGVARFTKCDLP